MHQSLVTEKYNRVAPVYDVLELPMELLVYTRWRQRLYHGLSGRILEIGAGTGKNARFWPRSNPPAVIEPSGRMTARVKHRAHDLGIEPWIVRGLGQALPFRGSQFDAVVASFVFCSVADPSTAMAETRRILRQRGELRLLEHQRPRSRRLAGCFDALNPLVVSLTGVNINRKTTEIVRDSGFNLLETVAFDPFGVFTLIRATPS